jgi:ABC-2 type transport system permease protein
MSNLLSSVHLFIELTKTSFQRQLTYRAATFAGLTTNFFFGMLRVAVMIALFGSRGDVNGYSLRNAITFTGLTQSLIGFLSLFGWYDMMNSIYTGAVACDLLKPMGYFNFWLAQDLGRALAQLVLRGFTMMIAYAVLIGISYPNGISQWVSLIASLILAWLISFSWRFLLNLSGFWTPDARAIGRFGFALLYFVTGFLMPLRFFPDWFVKICEYTPFPHMVNTVVEVYLGVLNGPELAWALVKQVGWTILLIYACRIMLKAGVRRLVIQGG